MCLIPTIQFNVDQFIVPQFFAVTESGAPTDSLSDVSLPFTSISDSVLKWIFDAQSLY